MSILAPCNTSKPSKQLLTASKEAVDAQQQYTDYIEGIYWMRETVHSLHDIFHYGDIDKYDLVKSSKNMATTSKFIMKHRNLFLLCDRQAKKAQINKRQRSQLKVSLLKTSNM